METLNLDPTQHQRWLDKHGFQPKEDGSFEISAFEGKEPVTVDKLLEYIRHNVSTVDYDPLYSGPYDERTFVMICGGPSLEDYLDEIREKSKNPDCLVVCSNMTANYLYDNDIVPAVHFILDPQEKKKYDVMRARPEVEYWINAACNPRVFQELADRGIKPKVFLADFAVGEQSGAKAVAESMQPGQPGMMAIQGGTMAGLRAMNLADALGFRKMEYYGFDASVKVFDDHVQPYAYNKKRGEAVITVDCDRCSAKFDTTLVFQKQINEFAHWRFKMPWIDITIHGPGLMAHAFEHLKAIESAQPYAKERYTEEYAALQYDLHAQGDYGTGGRRYIPSIFYGVSQLAKRLGKVTVLDYGCARANTMNEVRKHHWMPPEITDFAYDPFVPEYSGEPAPADMVICQDVMEHIEPQCTGAVLDHLAQLTKRICFFAIALSPANKRLSDGRNAHINLREPEWWLREIRKRFIPSEAKQDANVLFVVGQSIQDVKEILRNERSHADQKAA